jgi:hypothetical protein
MFAKMFDGYSNDKLFVGSALVTAEEIAPREWIDLSGSSN